MREDQGYGLINEHRVLEELKRRKLPVQHRVQIDYYEVDFLVGERIVIEVDGYVHLTKENIIKDRQKDDYLRQLGYHVLRVKGLEVRNRGFLRDFGRKVLELWEQEQRLNDKKDSTEMTQTLRTNSLEKLREQLLQSEVKNRARKKEKNSKKEDSKKSKKSDIELFLEWIAKEDVSDIDKGDV